MKNLIYIVLLLLLYSVSIQTKAQGDPEPYAKEIIKAYKNKDLALLKKHATAILNFALNEGFFESSDGKPNVEIAKTWDGKIKEIRYDKMEMMGQTAIIAMAYFSDNPNGNLNCAIVSSLDGSEWKAFGMGFIDLSKEEFMECSPDFPKDKPKEKTEKAEIGEMDVIYRGFTVEMASGETYDNPSINRLKASLKSIDDDNFFLILNSKNGFIQTTISDSGFIVQYNHGDGLFEAESYFDFDQLVDIFVAYLKNENWKDKDRWVRM